MLNAITKIDCSGCYGAGYIFYGDENDYHIEPCECVANEQLL